MVLGKLAIKRMLKHGINIIQASTIYPIMLPKDYIYR